MKRKNYKGFSITEILKKAEKEQPAINTVAEVEPIPEDFITLFLHEAGIPARSGKTVYICKEHHDRITRILHRIGKNKTSLFSYVYNVLEHHFETHREEIIELYEKNRESIF